MSRGRRLKLQPKLVTRKIDEKNVNKLKNFFDLREKTVGLMLNVQKIRKRFWVKLIKLM